MTDGLEVEWTFIIPEDCTTEEMLERFLRQQLDSHGIKPGDHVRVYMVPPTPEGKGAMKWWLRLMKVEDDIETRYRDLRDASELLLDSYKTVLRDVELMRIQHSEQWRQFSLLEAKVKNLRAELSWKKAETIRRKPRVQEGLDF